MQLKYNTNSFQNDLSKENLILKTSKPDEYDCNSNNHQIIKSNNQSKQDYSVKFSTNQEQNKKESFVSRYDHQNGSVKYQSQQQDSQDIGLYRNQFSKTQNQLQQQQMTQIERTNMVLNKAKIKRELESKQFEFSKQKESEFIQKIMHLQNESNRIIEESVKNSQAQYLNVPLNPYEIEHNQNVLRYHQVLNQVQRDSQYSEFKKPNQNDKEEKEKLQNIKDQEIQLEEKIQANPQKKLTPLAMMLQGAKQDQNQNEDLKIFQNKNKKINEKPELDHETYIKNLQCSYQEYLQKKAQLNNYEAQKNDKQKEDFLQKHQILKKMSKQDESFYEDVNVYIQMKRQKEQQEKQRQEAFDQSQTNPLELEYKKETKINDQRLIDIQLRPIQTHIVEKRQVEQITPENQPKKITFNQNTSNKKSQKSRAGSQLKSSQQKRNESCPYHPKFLRSQNSPFTLIDTNQYSPASNKRDLNISQLILLNQKIFKEQSELYQGQHNKFLYNASKCKVGSRADRVYQYYAYDEGWRRDRFLKISQEADNKTLTSREGRKLNLHEYTKKMTLKLS